MSSFVFSTLAPKIGVFPLSSGVFTSVIFSISNKGT
jgi:hypothetical protein